MKIKGTGYFFHTSYSFFRLSRPTTNSAFCASPYSLKPTGSIAYFFAASSKILSKFGFSAKKRWFCSKSNLDDLQTAVKLMRQMNKNGKYDKLLKAYTPIMATRPSETSPARLFFYAKKCEKELRKQNLLNH